ncbi:MAG: rhodanese-like domain-containing protein [Pseudomonadota bacterium]
MTASFSRRRILSVSAGTLGLFGLAGGAGFVAWYHGGEGSGRVLTPAEAYDQATRGDLILVDIRRPDEWGLTGVGAGAVPLDMRRDDFTAELSGLAGGDLGADIAVICARGVRSRHLSRRLSEAGFTRVHDVPEGMLGSGAGPGWLGRGLPVTEWTG